MFEHVMAARRRLEGQAHVTPVMTSATFNERVGGAVVFKCENFQRAGAFKFRGAWSRLSARVIASSEPVTTSRSRSSDSFPASSIIEFQFLGDADAALPYVERCEASNPPGDVASLVAGFAAALMGRYGVRKGDRVAILSRNNPQWMMAFVGATSIGAVAVPMNAWWTTQEMAYGLRDSRPKVLIADDEAPFALELFDDWPTEKHLRDFETALEEEIHHPGRGGGPQGHPETSLFGKGEAL